MAESNMKEFSSRQEKLVADALGGYQIGGSGAMPTAPGDVKTYDWLVECKTHTTPDHPIFFDEDVWKKINNEAMGTSRKPVLVVDDGSQKLEKTWCLCNSRNLNLSSTVTIDLPCAIRKNISCKHGKLAEAIKKTAETALVSFYDSVAFELTWGESEICIMPFNTFKELFEK